MENKNKKKPEWRLVLAEIGLGVTILIIVLGIALLCNRVFAFSDPYAQTPKTVITTVPVSTTTVVITTTATTSTTTATTTKVISTTTIVTTTIEEVVSSEEVFESECVSVETEEFYESECDSVETEELSESECNSVETEEIYEGTVLTPESGVVPGPSGKETFYNLPMEGVIQKMKENGFNYEYWIRSDGVRMYGDYVMVAADLSLRPRGSIVDTTLGTGIVCDTGQFIYLDPYQLDIAVTWEV